MQLLLFRYDSAIQIPSPQFPISIPTLIQFCSISVWNIFLLLQDFFIFTSFFRISGWWCIQTLPFLLFLFLKINNSDELFRFSFLSLYLSPSIESRHFSDIFSFFFFFFFWLHRPRDLTFDAFLAQRIKRYCFLCVIRIPFAQARPD